MVVCMLVEENLDFNIILFNKMVEFDRGDILDKTTYQFDMNGDVSDINSKKSWWLIGLLIGFVLNFLTFLAYYIFHTRKHAEKQMI